MEKIKKTRSYNTVNSMCMWSIVLILSIYSCLLCIQDKHKPKGYEQLYLLPLSFFFFWVLFYYILKKYLNRINIVGLLIICMLFLRNVVTPIFMIKDSYLSSLGLPDNADIAIILIVYETVCIFCLLYFLTKNNLRKKKKLFLYNGKNMYIFLKNRKLFKFLIFICLVICITTIIIIPEIRSQYYSIFTKNITGHIEQKANYSVGALSRVLYTGGDILIEVMRIIFPSILIISLRKKGENLQNLIVSLVIVVSQCLFMNDSNAYILMVMLSLILLILRLFGKYRKKIIKIGIAVGVIFLIVLYVNRFMMDHYGKSVSLFLQSYLPSIANTAGVFYLDKKQDFGQIFKDIFVAIPFKSTFGYSGNVKSIGVLWNEANGIRGQIISNIGVGYYYFGFVLSPLVTCFSLYVSYIMQNKMNETQYPFEYVSYSYFMIYSALMPFTYNFSIYAQCFLERMIFLFLISYVCNIKFKDVFIDKKV